MNRNAYRGRNVEILFRNSVSDHPSVINAIKSAYSITGNFRTGISSGIHAEKRDVTLEFTCGRNIDANIKSYGEMAYNQMTRTSIEHFCGEFGLSCQDWLEELFLSKARNVSQKLFSESEQPKALGIFSPIARRMVKWSLAAKTSREILVLFASPESLFRIYKMDDVLRHVGYDIGFTARGNLTIGDYIVFQRKGGNGASYCHMRKDDIRHPGNNVQLKLKVHDFVDGMKPYMLSSYGV